jgi:hypothetical protein
VQIDALVMATYGGPLIKQASRDNMLKLPAPLNKTDSFDSLIGILKSLPDTDCGSPIRSRHVPTPSVPFPSIPPPFEGSRRKKRLSSVMTSEAFAPLSLSPNRLAAKVEALQVGTPTPTDKALMYFRSTIFLHAPTAPSCVSRPFSVCVHREN